MTRLFSIGALDSRAESRHFRTLFAGYLGGMADAKTTHIEGSSMKTIKRLSAVSLALIALAILAPIANATCNNATLKGHYGFTFSGFSYGALGNGAVAGVGLGFFDGNGNFTFTGIPNGSWRVTVFDQWNDMLVDGLSTPVGPLSGGTKDMGEIAMNQWQANIYTSTFFDKNANGVRDADEEGLALVATNIRFRDGSYSNFNNTDLNGNAGFNEVFPLFSWYVVETDSTPSPETTSTSTPGAPDSPVSGTPFPLLSNHTHPLIAPLPNGGSLVAATFTPPVNPEPNGWNWASRLPSWPL